jgi:hypothetical protein
MRRRLDQDGEAKLAEWIAHWDPDTKTRRLIAEALEAYAGNPGQIRFYSAPDLSDRSVTVIEPEEGLAVHVQAADPEEFTLLRVVDER